MGRRTFLWYGSGMMAVAQEMWAKPQQAILEKGRAKVCDTEVVKCPLGHETCKKIDAPIAVGNDSYQYPEVAQIQALKLLMCEQCGVLFVKP